jgi:hypothetical protein
MTKPDWTPYPTEVHRAIEDLEERESCRVIARKLLDNPRFVDDICGAMRRHMRRQRLRRLAMHFAGWFVAAAVVFWWLEQTG